MLNSVPSKYHEILVYPIKLGEKEQTENEQDRKRENDFRQN